MEAKDELMADPIDLDIEADASDLTEIFLTTKRLELVCI